MASLFTGQAVLVARFAGAGDPERVNRVVQQAFLTAIGMFVVMAAIGYFAAPAPARPGQRRARGQGSRRCRSCASTSSCSIGMLLFFMLSAALRAAGDARTPLRLGVTMTVLNVILNVLLIRGFGPIPALGHGRLGAGHVDRLRRRQLRTRCITCSRATA